MKEKRRKMKERIVTEMKRKVKMEMEMKRKLMEKVMRGERRKDYSRAKSGTNLRRGQRIRFKR